MTFYFYQKKACHKSADTDKMIAESIRRRLGVGGEIKILRTELGKPYIENMPIYVGVTHTDDTVIIALDDENFGIDCEYEGRAQKNAEKIAERYFTENERQKIFNSADRAKMFLDIWVKKEAYVKFTGHGLSGMKTCDVTTLSSFERIENDRNLIIYIYKEKNNE